MWSCLCWRCDLLTTSNKCNKLSSCVYCHLLAFFACETLHSIQHYFYKTNPFHIFWSFNSHFSIGPWLQQLREILKATALQREKSVSLGKLLCVTLTSSTSQGHYAIALKFSAKQINLIRKKSVSVICKIMNINGDFRIIVNANHGAFMKNTKTQIKLKPIFFFWKLRSYFCRDCYDLDVCQHSEENINVCWSWRFWKFFLRLKIKARAFYEYLIYIK